jgi:hypothetical protein
MVASELSNAFLGRQSARDKESLVVSAHSVSLSALFSQPHAKLRLQVTLAPQQQRKWLRRTRIRLQMSKFAISPHSKHLCAQKNIIWPGGEGELLKLMARGDKFTADF